MNKNSVTEMKKNALYKIQGKFSFEAVMQFMENYYVSVIKDYKNEKVLWVNPSFLDYRIPLYDELNKLYQNNFHLIYSKHEYLKDALTR